MSDGTSIPAIGLGVQELPPRELRVQLRASEQLVWWGRGQGSTFDSTVAVGTVVAVVMLAAIAFDVIDMGSARWPTFVYFSLFWLAWILPTLLIGARYEIYGLTTQRLLYIPGLPPAIRYGIGREGGLSGALDKLEVKGSRERGNILLQSPSGWVHPFRKTGGIRLTGVEHPLEVALLIQSTLELDIPIEDRTR